MSDDKDDVHKRLDRMEETNAQIAQAIKTISESFQLMVKMFKWLLFNDVVFALAILVIALEVF